MSKFVIIGCCFLIAAICIFGGLKAFSADTFQVTSQNIIPHQLLNKAHVYNANGCLGDNISPQLSWSNAPQGTQSFAIICHNPDAPRPHSWYHWLVVNIPLNVKSIAQGEKIKGATETITDFKTIGYGGACPPVGHGIHHYNFTVYALDVDKLDVNKDSKPTEVEKKVLAHSIAKSTITALYERK